MSSSTPTGTTTELRATSPATTTVDASFWSNMVKGFTGYVFLPDFTEHPKPKRKHVEGQPGFSTDGAETDVTFMHDFVAGGAAGCASVIVGHPFDTIKVRLQTSTSTGSGMLTSLGEFGGVKSLFRGMGAPLSAATAVNAIVFSSYGLSSRFFDENIKAPEEFVNHTANHDPWQKAMSCGMFAGLTQCFIICPMEHIKCRLQIQHGRGSADYKYKGPVQATRSIFKQHGIQRLYQGWWSTALREVPAFGLYFAAYDYLKDRANIFLAKQAGIDETMHAEDHSHTWMASAFAGGCAGSITWAIVYPIDVIKTRVQTASLDTPMSQLRMWKVGSEIAAQHGWRYLFRGLGITLLRAFPVNGTIFPVYEFTLKQVTEFTDGN